MLYSTIKNIWPFLEKSVAKKSLIQVACQNNITQSFLLNQYYPDIYDYQGQLQVAGLSHTIFEPRSHTRDILQLLHNKFGFKTIAKLTGDKEKRKQILQKAVKLAKNKLGDNLM